MRDDLLDAQTAVDWAVSKIQPLQERFISWQSSNPYRVSVGHDPDADQDLAVAIEEIPLPRILNAETGAIINSLRSALSTFWPPRSLVATEIATIESLKPYRGADDCLWPLSQLDNIRKHDRLIFACSDGFGSLFYKPGYMRESAVRAR